MTVDLNLSEKEFTIINELAQKTNMPIADFVKHLVFKHIANDPKAQKLQLPK